MACARGILGDNLNRILTLLPPQKILSCHGSLFLGDLTGHSPAGDDIARTISTMRLDSILG